MSVLMTFLPLYRNYGIWTVPPPLLSALPNIHTHILCTYICLYACMCMYGTIGAGFRRVFHKVNSDRPGQLTEVAKIIDFLTDRASLALNCSSIARRYLHLPGWAPRQAGRAAGYPGRHEKEREEKKEKKGEYLTQVPNLTSRGESLRCGWVALARDGHVHSIPLLHEHV